MIRYVLLAVLAVAGLTYGIIQTWEIKHRDSLIGQLNKEVLAMTAASQEARSAADALKLELAAAKENIERLKAERDAALAKSKAGGPAEAGAPSSTAAAKNEGEGLQGFGAFAKMFESEEGRKMMKTQTMMATRMMYGELGKRLGLSPQDADQLLALLGERQGALSEAGMKRMANGQLDEATGKQIAEENKAIQAEYDSKLKAILGEEKFGQMKEYEKTLGDRMMMTQYEQSFNAAGVPLGGEQRESLLKIMADERKKSPPSPFDNSGQDMARNMAAMRDDANFEKHFEQEAAYQQRVLDAATTVLNPDQINALRQGFQQWGEMQKFGMKMMQGMMKGNSAKPAAPAPPAQ